MLWIVRRMRLFGFPLMNSSTVRLWKPEASTFKEVLLINRESYMKKAGLSQGKELQ